MKRHKQKILPGLGVLFLLAGLGMMVWYGLPQKKKSDSLNLNPGIAAEELQIVLADDVLLPARVTYPQEWIRVGQENNIIFELLPGKISEQEMILKIELYGETGLIVQPEGEIVQVIQPGKPFRFRWQARSVQKGMGGAVLKCSLVSAQNGEDALILARRFSWRIEPRPWLRLAAGGLFMMAGLGLFARARKMTLIL